MNHIIYYILKSSSAKGTERAGSDNWPKVFVQETLLRVKYVYKLLKCSNKNKIKSKNDKKQIDHAHCNITTNHFLY